VLGRDEVCGVRGGAWQAGRSPYRWSSGAGSIVFGQAVIFSPPC
jgi:hypothetical protein